MKPSSISIADGNLLLTLHPAEEGGYVVTSPNHPELITEAESLEEAVVNARDALKALTESRMSLQLDARWNEILAQRFQDY